ncbi:intersectin-EH binding protein Ibp1 [Mycolicibacterium elephantis]|uniref:intersectin-EH binding protein Ibp1 n=1 Tax=Mycolicibacterium elephantis TaxID=81858 RepID=UPI003A8B8665
MTPSCAVRRQFVIGAFLVAAAAAPVAAAHHTPQAGNPLAECSSGEESDTFTTTCVPYLVPTSPPVFTTTAANPDVPEVDGIPCIGHNAGGCIGLAEDAQMEGPPAQPRVTISSSP